ncbi:MAG: dephospho-CoA kinase [Actinomycetota bacterium]
MLVVALTGGIGSGKSTFARFLAERGAELIDADSIGREALKPGQPAWRSAVSQFGEGILEPGTNLEIDRGRLAEIVFADKEALAALNAIVHPVILRRIADELDTLAGTAEIVVIDAALVVETGMHEWADVLLVVVSEQERRTDRLVRDRGMSVGDISARMAAQTDPLELMQKADFVVHNDGSLAELEVEADRVWKELSALRDNK